MKKLDYRLINIALISLILYLVIKSSDFWLFLIFKIYDLILPILIGFMISYFLYPIFSKLNKKLNKKVSLIILLIFIFFIIFLMINLLIPIFSYELLNVIDYLIDFIKKISLKYNINLDYIQTNLSNIFDYIFKNITGSVLFTINSSISFFTKTIICISCAIYFLIDMDKIRIFIKRYLKKYPNLYLYFKVLDSEMNKYIKGFLNILIISFFEYTLIYILLHHPDFLLLGLISSLANIIPCFGAIIAFVIALITSFSISRNLGITVLIISFILSIFDNYVINPYVYDKTNKLHPLISVISVFLMGSIFKLFGVFISIPVSIILVTTIKYLKQNKTK